MSDYLSGAYFEVLLLGVGVMLSGRFTAVSGLGMELEYDTYNEGGCNYPRYFFKEVKPRVLVLQQGVVSHGDSAAKLMGMCNLGMDIPLAGTITLKDGFGASKRVWSVVGAHLQKYEGPELNANQAAVAVSRIELLHNGCY